MGRLCWSDPPAAWSEPGAVPAQVSRGASTGRQDGRGPGRIEWLPPRTEGTSTAPTPSPGDTPAGKRYPVT